MSTLGACVRVAVSGLGHLCFLSSLSHQPGSSTTLVFVDMDCREKRFLTLIRYRFKITVISDFRGRRMGSELVPASAHHASFLLALPPKSGSARLVELNATFPPN